MIKHLAITALVDNRSEDQRLLTEHGLSLWIEADGRHILFDTGQSDYFLHNAETLGINPRDADTLVISHGHYDHTGGVVALLKVNPTPRIYCHPGIFIPRYSRQADGNMKPIGLSRTTADALHRRVDTIHWVSRPLFLTKNIGVTGPIPRVAAFEDTGGAFFLDPGGKRPDMVEDDVAMWFSTAGGLVVVTGCCHSGIVNTIAYISSITGANPVASVIGGLHLLHASAERIEATCDYLQSSGVGKIVPFHCTGEEAVAHFERRFGEAVVKKGGVGKIVI